MNIKVKKNLCNFIRYYMVLTRSIIGVRKTLLPAGGLLIPSGVEERVF